jgi:hypothetical protein
VSRLLAQARLVRYSCTKQACGEKLHTSACAKIHFSSLSSSHRGAKRDAKERELKNTEAPLLENVLWEDLAQYVFVSSSLQR